MDSFGQAAGIDMTHLSYILIPLLVVITIAIVVMGLSDMLKVLRAGELEAVSFLSGLFKAVGTVIAIVALVYFINK